MATAFTHALLGASLVRFKPEGTRYLRLAPVLALIAVAPDLDVIAFRFGIPYEDPLGHRGLTHGVPFAVAVGWLSGRLWHDATQRWRIALLGFIACASHGVLDAMTDAGLGVGFWIPFDDTRSFFAWRPIETSPIGIRRFFSGQALSILASEARAVWLPWGIVWFATATAWSRFGGPRR